MMHSRAVAKLLTVIGAGIAALAFLAPAAFAEAPLEGFERFSGCPNKEESATTTSCQLATITGGHLQMGTKDVPINKPIVLSGGTNPKGEEFKSSPTGGLSETKLEVPGGVIGITGLDWLVNLLNAEALKLYAVTELVGPPKITPAAFELPLRVHLINVALGNNCYVGSATTPILLKLITGTTSPPSPNEPITGKAPKFTAGTPKGVGHFIEGIFVDNSFAAPAAKGCALFGAPLVSLDSVVNLLAGLPAAAGTNETIQNFELEIASRKLVYG
jgi:hypothetical protein